MLDSNELVVLVDGDDREIGQADKLDAHRAGKTHRAISVCLIDSQGRMLLQRRADAKYHSGGLWTNACCTHPRPAEGAAAAAGRRLREELGVDCPLTFLKRTHYRAAVGGDLTEDEVVHLFLGVYDGPVRPDPSEVSQVRSLSRQDLFDDVAAHPADYTYWFKLYLDAFGDLLFRAAARA